MNEKKRRLRRSIVCLLMMAVMAQTLCGNGVTVAAKEQENIVTKDVSVQSKTRTQTISLGTEEQENAEEGWSWNKDDDDPLSYTLTLNNVNFEVPDDSAISLYVNEGTPIRFINIVLIGENRIISTKQADWVYNGSGIYVNADDAAVKPSVLICGGGSLTVQGSRCGLNIPGCLNVEDVTLDARSDTNGAVVVKETLSMRNSTLQTNTLRAQRLTASGCDILASMTVSSSQATSLITVESCEIDKCTVQLTGPESEDAYAAISSSSQDELIIKNSSLNIKNVDKGIYIQTGTITLEHATGTLFCSNTGTYLNGNPALYANNVNVSDSTIFAQTGYHIYSWGDCSLPEEIRELTVSGDLMIEAGKTFTIGEGQKVIFERNPAYIKGEEGAALINNGTCEFTGSTRAQVKTQFVNHGTLIADGIDCDHTQFTNTGEFNGEVNEKSGVVKYIYGKVTQGYNCSLGGSGNWIVRRFIMPGAELTILTGNKMDATGGGKITWDNLSEFLTVGEGGSIIVPAGAVLLLPADDTNQNVESLNLSGAGAVQIGDTVLHKVTYMDGADTWKSSFANGDNMVSEPDVPVREGYLFRGWFTEPEEGEEFDFGSPIENDLTLYARWDIRPVNVAPKAGSSVSVKDGEFLTYGQTLSELAFAPAVFVEEGTETEVAGTLSWKTPSAVPKAGTVSAEWVFTPADSSKYLEQTGTTAITVVKAVPEVKVPVAGTITYHPSITLENLELETVDDATAVEGTWNWKNSATVPTVGNDGYTAVFTPKDVVNYQTVECTVPVNVKPATPYISVLPAAAQITQGDSLGASVLSDGAAHYSSADSTEVPGSFAWKDASIKPDLADSDKTDYAVVFTPSDRNNYESVEVTVRVNIASVACEHKNTRLVNAKAATEKTEGYTGDIICADCHEIVKPGSVIPALGNSGNASEPPVQTPAGGLQENQDAKKEEPSAQNPFTQEAEKKESQKHVSRQNVFLLNAGIKARQTGRKLRVAWGKVPGADGYDICVQYCGKRYRKKVVKSIKNGSKTKTVIRKINNKALNRKRNFKIYVVAYKLTDSKKVTLARSMALHIAGKSNKKYTDVKRITVEKRSYVLKKGSSVRIRPKAVRYNKKKKLFLSKHVKRFRYISSDENVATVSAKGTIAANETGSCTVYVCAGNGCKRKITIRVE